MARSLPAQQNSMDLPVFTSPALGLKVLITTPGYFAWVPGLIAYLHACMVSTLPISYLAIPEEYEF